jgi:ectoine hydroxylase-related dioxygenase (phytanoyl-CoA dioxygenase family)
VIDEDRYLFDLQGYVVVPEALSADAVARLNAQIDAMTAAETDPDMRTHRFGQLLGRDQSFRELIDNGPVVDVISELLGENFRLDHDYADVIRSGTGPIGARLHGGAVPFRASEYYWTDGHAIHSGLVAVAYNLKDVGEGDGGFACVPGSHKSSFRFPEAWKPLEEVHPCVRKVGGPAGSAIVFTEALVHGTLPWAGAHERRTIFYKYSPAPISWAHVYYDTEEYPELTERQRVMLRAPSARPPSVTEVG